MRGGRSCVHPDTLLDTPNGQVKIKDFYGGIVYSFHEGKKIKAYASQSMSFTKEQLYEVALCNGKKIICTDEHKFLTDRGWIMLKSLASSDRILCETSFASLSHLLTNLALYPLKFSSSVLRCLKKPLNYLGNCFLYRRLCDQQLLLVKDSDLTSFPSQGGVQQRNSRALFRSGGLELLSIYNLSCILRRLSNFSFLPLLAKQNYKEMENYNGEKSFEQPLGFFQSLVQSRKNKNHPLQVHSILSQLPYHGIETNQDKIHQKASRILSAFFFCKSKHNSFQSYSIKSVRKHSRQTYYDIHVPIYNNYLSNGIVNHNSGKSHERAEALVEAMVIDPDLKCVGIREKQKSIQYSSFQLIKEKISYLGVDQYFDIFRGEIRRKGGNGVCIFTGMMDHTADSIKGLEGFKIAWCEEAQNLSKRSLDLLRPTIIRNANYEMWFTWNPDQEDDAIELFHKQFMHKGVTVHVNYDQNPFLNAETVKEIEDDRVNIPDDFDHVWLGAYNTRSDVRVFQKWRVEECEPTFDDDVYFGADFGFAKDPSTLLRTWKNDRKKEIYIDWQIDGVGIETDSMPDFYMQIPEVKKWKITADSARPETISYISRRGFNCVGAKKGNGSVEDGIDWLRGYTIVVHPRCKLLQKELRLYSYKVDKVGNILPKVDDKAGLDHCIDALRYAWEDFIRNETGGGFLTI